MHSVSACVRACVRACVSVCVCLSVCACVSVSRTRVLEHIFEKHESQNYI